MGEFAFKLPDVGEGVAEAEIVAWHVKPGDLVAEDQPFVDVMTDKATVEITSPVAGRLKSVAVAVGASARVGSIIALIETDATAASSPAESPQRVAAAPEPAAPAASAPRAAQRETAATRPLAAPAVRQRARDNDVALSDVRGTGPAGRITHADLEAHLARGSRKSESARRTGVETVKVMGLRRRIAERMQEAKRRIPHFSYIEEVDVTELERLRASLNGVKADRPKLTLLPFLVRALAVAIETFPQMNATFDDDAEIIERHAALHAGIATQTANGLVVPVLRHAESLSLWAAAAEISRLADAARAGKATREELSGSTITITSLGALGGLATTPVINRPEVAIIGPNKIIERPVVLNGAIVVRKMMNVSASFDHRVIDGWDAAEFVQRIKALLETPALLFVERT